MARACRFTAPYGSREIHHDGKPFITITRSLNKFDTGYARPTDVDTVAREIRSFLCGEKRGRSSLAGAGGFLDKLFGKKKPKRNPMSKRMYFVPGAGKNPMARRGEMTTMGRARRKRRKR